MHYLQSMTILIIQMYVPNNEQVLVQTFYQCGYLLFLILLFFGTVWGGVLDSPFQKIHSFSKDLQLKVIHLLKQSVLVYKIF